MRRGPAGRGEVANVFQQMLRPFGSGVAQSSPLSVSLAHLFIYILSGVALVPQSSDDNRDWGATKAKIFALRTLTENI